MTFKDALQKLDIEDFGERIFNSNSQGELMHIEHYTTAAEMLDNTTGWFRPWFVAVVAEAEKQWHRPESVFQHLPRLLNECT